MNAWHGLISLANNIIAINMVHYIKVSRVCFIVTDLRPYKVCVCTFYTDMKKHATQIE